MKKILLALMLFSSFSFAWTLVGAVSSGQTFFSDPNYFIVGTPTNEGTVFIGWRYSEYGCETYNFDGISTIQYYQCSPSGESFYRTTLNFPLTNIGTNPPPSTCTATQELINNVCVEKCPKGQERIEGVCVNSCNQMIGEFRKSDGTCQDCSSYTNFSSRAFCACDSQGTTYTPQALVTATQTNGNYTYKKTNVTCDDGLRVAIYTDPVNINPQDYNSTLNQNGTITPDTNHTTPMDSNATPITPPVQTNNDVVEAVKAGNDTSKEIKTEIGKVATDIKSMNTELAKQGTTFNEVLASIKANGTENAKSNQLLGDMKTDLAQFKNKFGQWVDDTKNDSANEVAAINGVKTAVDAKGTATVDKLDEILKAIKEDSNGTGKADNNGTQNIDLNETNKKLDTLHDDNNKSHAKLDTLHDDANKTNSTLSDIKSLLDFNGSKYTLENMLPPGGEGWFTSNALKLNFNTSSANCYCQTAQFNIGGHSFVFPPQEALDVIPFSIISNIFMAFIFVLGLKNFLKS